METVQRVEMIGLGKLHAHPKNSNVVPAGILRKLERHIGAAGRYEPLVVRPHPEIAGEFQLINGHHRKRVLEKLGHGAANCIVWDLSDAETLLLLATINRLGGDDAPGKRLDLLEALSETMKASSEELAGLLPEDQGTLEKLLGEAGAVGIAAAPELGAMPEAFTVFMSGSEKRVLVAALLRTDADARVALLRWAGRIENGE